MYKFAAEIQIRSQGSRLLTFSAPHINHNPAKMIKKILPDLIAILAFVLISFAYFFPADIEGRILFQHDTAAGAGAGQEAKEYYEQTGNKVGFKPAGGINTVNDALIYYTIVKEVLGKEWLSNELFRLGTSRLANLLLSEIKGEELKFF